MDTILERLTYLKDKSGMNEKLLTSTLNISTTSFTDWRRGKGSPSLDAVSAFSSYFNVSLDWIVYGKELSGKSILEISNPEDRLFLEKYHSIPKELQMKLDGYLDGMLDASKHASEKNN